MYGMWATTKSIREPEAILGESQVCIPTPVSLFGVTPMKQIPLTQGQFAIVDDEDFDWLNQWKWYAYKAGNTFYARRNEGKYPNRRTIIMHKEIEQTNSFVDHHNRNGLDNRRYNLRGCTNRQNCRNRAKHENSTSIFKGVSLYRKTNKWKAQICFNYKVISLGYFHSEVAAAKVYDAKAKELFGEFANTNF